uniref:MIP18 family-like domain-containing protein n=1 Tax=Aplanochytrium stocchinoi TaxID=215587 RepID=A0A7S3V2I2_9STRA|mmetsp:Transcript_10347/g.12921  ORF Transcript_10347/g.12921 Transcript_10347/m.12921 type:complete len:159 (+) Transcript_10347:290-766(+)|eukprot:CAMPEP_0204839946 /NCGR_PEP_ID=MMETSP1346-20131115/35823_1 /ASSEMBLY_ACC=CAM_ASM_000771 /TAXON_ID=215587 /ORGANISM="Aplanochytrium stocchinoi, Strain GSBS06" /LENGTH=158 /DNA_ID=CAMNT_0051977017 /DNA_START=324 /DNA_END=800 /DNA_ORIENTATION=+
MTDKLNANPTVYSVSKAPARSYLVEDIEDEESKEEIDAEEVFDLIRGIQDPEHPLTLEQLNVAQLENVHVDDERSKIEIFFTPTVPHCSMSTLIGLCLRVKLLRSIPTRFKVDIYVQPGTHSSEHAVNKQLNDKERVAAALENNHLIQVVNKCLTAQS